MNKVIGFSVKKTEREWYWRKIKTIEVIKTILNNYFNCQETDTQAKPVSQRSFIGTEVTGEVLNLGIAFYIVIWETEKL